MPINELYHTWFMKIKQLQPTERITRIRNFAWLIVGMYLFQMSVIRTKEEDLH